MMASLRCWMIDSGVRVDCALSGEGGRGRCRMARTKKRGGGPRGAAAKLTPMEEDGDSARSLRGSNSVLRGLHLDGRAECVAQLRRDDQVSARRRGVVLDELTDGPGGVDD